jgi:hypothetical protein
MAGYRVNFTFFTVWSYRNLTTRRRNVLPHSSKMSVNFQQTLGRDISQENNYYDNSNKNGSVVEA